MMRFLIPLLLCFCFHLRLSAQSIPQDANTIIITIPDSIKGDAYRSLATLLTDQGFNIEKSDKELGYINTDRKEVKWNWEVRVIASIRDNKIRFTGKQFAAGYDKSESSIKYTGLKNAMYKTCFREVERVAKLFPHQSIEYAAK